MSILFIIIEFIVTENNAKYLLSGYNTMSDDTQKKSRPIILHSVLLK
ncbi:DUF3784 domain-containing protein [Formosa undariae]|uniref:DUF3784 domain-containing protein n=1 Tax=Formosa undariae TaxID=1325436 RepID=A0ABV5F013_9FLAO